MSAKKKQMKAVSYSDLTFDAYLAERPSLRLDRDMENPLLGNDAVKLHFSR